MTYKKTEQLQARETAAVSFEQLGLGKLRTARVVGKEHNQNTVMAANQC